MENNTFDELKKLDDLSELKELADEEHKPIFDAKIGYILKKMGEKRLIAQQCAERYGR